MSEVRTLLKELSAGRVTLDEVAADFAKRDWPAAGSGPARSYEDMATRELQDPEPIKENSWGEVMAAYTSGELTDEQYRALVEARTRKATP